MKNIPILYSFRRCPYAIRARIAIELSQVKVITVEVSLKDKPAKMLIASPKATVPVLILNDGGVIDESLQIMLWALKQKDPMNLLNGAEQKQSLKLIKLNDESFKSNLDYYKYWVRFPEKTMNEYRQQCDGFLSLLEQHLSNNKYLCGEKTSLADYAIFPFVRQFSSVDRGWFEQSKYQYLVNWLNLISSSALFKTVMKKS